MCAKIKQYSYLITKVTRGTGRYLLLFYQKIPSKITLITALSSLAVAIGTFWTISIVNKQNRVTIQPELLINNEEMVFLTQRYGSGYVQFYSSNGEIDTGCFISYKSAGDFQIGEPIGANKFRFNLVNVGLGTAKNIELTWSFDTASLIRILNNNSVPFADSAALDDRRIIIFSKADTSYQWEYDAVLETSFAFILPYATSKEIAKCRLPYLYLRMLGLYHFINCEMKLQSLKEGTYREIDGAFPELHFTITYSDIADNVFFRKYCISISEGRGMGSSTQWKQQRRVEFKLVE